MLLTGKELRAIFQHLSPFDAKGNLMPETERVTILASNVNLPLEIQGRAFAMAAAHGKQSPMIVQVSYNSAETIGNDPNRLKPLDGVDVTLQEAAVVAGARQAAELLGQYAANYGARYIALALDHFQVPKYDEQELSAKPRERKRLDRRLAEARILHAAEYMYPVFGAEADLNEQTLRTYINYLVSPEYAAFRRSFLATVQAVKPAWGMIDTEKLPPILDFVVTREIAEAVRQLLGNEDMMIEAEFGATGTSGKAIAYQKLSADELEVFARKVACFVTYTGADGIAYPIGMEHAAKKEDKHEPDVERLLAVQREIYRSTGGRYVPFAQHGGTGAASLARGLVGKNNINTHYLVAGANALADHVQAHVDGIRAGDKKYAGTGIYLQMLQATAEAALKKLGETGSLDKGPELAQAIAGVKSNPVASRAPGHKDDPYAE